MVKRIMVTLDDEQYEILKKIKGFGTKDAEKIRNIIIAYLAEKSYIKTAQE
ncbi:CopG family transcriptional regulator [Candidatus Bathyarchaeota archaeon]|nr:CopG family transcriptional regulator [Candidatus Bathyarchaeota archaeon]MBS7647373.1 CopG family transcriptional regulator [Candidatus Bathyarchaeota archaeon]